MTAIIPNRRKTHEPNALTQFEAWNQHKINLINCWAASGRGKTNIIA